MIKSRLYLGQTQNCHPDYIAELVPAEYWGAICEDLGTHDFFDQMTEENPFNVGADRGAVLGRTYHPGIVGMSYHGNDIWGWVDYDNYHFEVLLILANAVNQRKYLAFGVIDEVPILPGFRQADVANYSWTKRAAFLG